MFSKMISNYMLPFILLVSAIVFALGSIEIKASEKQSENPSRVMEQKTKVIGILMPMDHAALREIVSGFKDKLSSLSKDSLEFKVQNAQGDMNVQRSIIQQFVNQKVDVIVPIGTTATQMAVKLAREQPIVSLAAIHKANQSTGQSTEHSYESSDNQKLPKMTGVLDEIGPKKPLTLLAKVIPSLQKITLVHSSSEKVFPEIEELMNYARTQNLEVQKLMIQTLPDIYTISRLIDKDSEAIFILKDHLVVSGVKALVQEAKKKHIPVVAMDEGSVKEGASFALGVKERIIGEQGAILAYKVMSGIPAEKLPLETLDQLSVFYNEKACLEQGIRPDHLKNMARESGYEVTAL